MFMVFNSYSQLYKFVDNILTSNNNFSSLDIKICQKKKIFTSSAFRKPTFSCVFINFDNLTPISYKHSLVNNVIFQHFKICTSYEKTDNEIKYLKKVFKYNSYYNNFVGVCNKCFLINFKLPKQFFKRWKKAIIDNCPIFG